MKSLNKAKMGYFFKKLVDSRVDLAKLFIVNEDEDGGGGDGRSNNVEEVTLWTACKLITKSGAQRNCKT